MNKDTNNLITTKLNNSKHLGPKTFKILNENSSPRINSQSIPKLRSSDLLKNMYSEDAGKTIKSILETKKNFKTLFKTELNL